jgi:hypothetical protein
MSAGLPSGFGIGGSAAKTVLNDDRANAVIAMDDRAKALRVMYFCFIFVCLFCVLFVFLTKICVRSITSPVSA